MTRPALFPKMRPPLQLRDWIGIFLITAFISVLLALMFKDIPTANEQLIVYMLGQLSGFVATIVGYHYVTSVGDADKTANTGKALDAIKSVAENSSTTPTDTPQPVTVVNDASEPVPTTTGGATP